MLLTNFLCLKSKTKANINANQATQMMISMNKPLLLPPIIKTSLIFPLISGYALIATPILVNGPTQRSEISCGCCENDHAICHINRKNPLVNSLKLNEDKTNLHNELTNDFNCILLLNYFVYIARIMRFPKLDVTEAICTKILSNIRITWNNGLRCSFINWNLLKRKLLH